MSFDENYKNRIGEQLTDRLIKALEEGEVTMETLPEISGYILDNINAITTHEQLVAFLEQLSSRWPIFANITTIEEGEIKEKQEEKKIAQVENLIHEQKLDEALKVAESATHQQVPSITKPTEGGGQNGSIS